MPLRKPSAYAGPAQSGFSGIRLVLALVAALILAYGIRIVADFSKTRREKGRIVLSGMRGASIGGEYVKLFTDKKAEFGLYGVRQNRTLFATYEVRQDTVFFSSPTAAADSLEPFFVLRDGEIARSGGRPPLRIIIDKLREGMPPR